MNMEKMEISGTEWGQNLQIFHLLRKANELKYVLIFLTLTSKMKPFICVAPSDFHWK